MSAAAAKLIEEFDAFSPADKAEVAHEILLKLPPFDSGPLDDETLGNAGDEIARLLDEEENASAAG